MDVCCKASLKLGSETKKDKFEGFLGGSKKNEPGLVGGGSLGDMCVLPIGFYEVLFKDVAEF